MNVSTSSFRIRPFFPVPVTCCIATSLSRAYFRTDGIAITRLPESCSSLLSVSTSLLSWDDSDAVWSAVLSSSFAGSSSSSSSSSSSYPSASNVTIVSPTTATVPSSTCIFSTVPSTGEGISTTDLSFCTSHSVSSSAISSPSLTNHVPSLPSCIPSPISGNLNLDDMSMTPHLYNFQKLITSCTLLITSLGSGNDTPSASENAYTVSGAGTRRTGAS